LPARAALATAYQACGQPDEAAQAVKEMTRITPTAETFAIASRLYAALGKKTEARAEARRAAQLRIQN